MSSSGWPGANDLTSPPDRSTYTNYPRSGAGASRMLHFAADDNNALLLSVLRSRGCLWQVRARAFS